MKLPLQTWSQLSSITGNVLRPAGLVATNEALAYCQFKKEAVLLDVGCGLGGTIEHLQALGFSCIGLDVSQDLLRQQATRLALAQNIEKDKGIMDGTAQNEGLGFTEYTKSTRLVRPLLVQGDSRHMPLQNASVQGIFCECVLSLLEKPTDILQDFYRILQDGGKLVLTDIIRADTIRADSIPKEVSPKLEKTEALACAKSSFPCLNGALPLAILRGLLLDAGFTLRLESDYSRNLAELSALLILHDMKFEDVFFSHKMSCDCTQKPTFGYVLLVAEKSIAKPTAKFSKNIPLC